MRLLRRNKQKCWYAAYAGKEPITEEDEYGNQTETGEYRVLYEEPVMLKCYISPATGSIATEYFGNLDGYDKILIIGDPKTPIDENTVMWIDAAPTSDGVAVGVSNANPHDYIVKRVSRGLRSAVVAVSKVTVSE